MTAKWCVAAAALVVAAATAWAQPQPPQAGDGPSQSPRPPQGAQGMNARPAGPAPGDRMEQNFFPPELVMRNQKALALTPDQQSSIRSEMQKMIARFTDLQWQLSAEEETMESLVKADRPDEKQILAQLDKVLTIENDIKRSQLTALVRIKNLLTAEQQAKLTELKKRAESWMQGQGGRGPGAQRMQEGQPPDDGQNPGGQRQGGQRQGGQRPSNPPPPPPDRNAD